MVALVISCSAIVGIPCDRSTRSAYRESERTSVMCDCTEVVAHSDTQDFHIGYSFNSCYALRRIKCSCKCCPKTQSVSLDFLATLRLLQYCISIWPLTCQLNMQSW